MSTHDTCRGPCSCGAWHNDAEIWERITTLELELAELKGHQKSDAKWVKEYATVRDERDQLLEDRDADRAKIETLERELADMLEHQRTAASFLDEYERLKQHVAVQSQHQERLERDYQTLQQELEACRIQQRFGTPFDPTGAKTGTEIQSLRQDRDADRAAIREVAEILLVPDMLREWRIKHADAIARATPEPGAK